MEVKISIPESIKDITLKQYQQYIKLIDDKDLMDEYTFLKMVISLFTGLTLEQIDNIKQIDLEYISESITKALNQEVEFERTFEMGGIEFGFIPNFDKIQSKEFFDLSGYTNKVDELHKVMSVLFRPIKSKGLNNTYTIESYQGTDEWAEAMRSTPLHIVNGALGFFLTLQVELQAIIQRYLEEEQMRESKQTATLKSGDGMQRLTI